MRRFSLHRTLLALLLAAVPAWAISSRPQDSGQKQGDKQDPKQPESKPPADKQSDDSSSSSSSSSAASQELQQPDQGQKYDPLPAEKDVEVGTFYMHKGNLDAAIARFEDAIQMKANYARPRLLLAQIYEKKGDKASAVKYYKEYLQVFPHAADAKKIQEKIEKLTAR
jgi:tetratricopeptide (TPR) repeat protein